MKKQDGKMLREQVFDYRRGELAEVDRALFEEEMLAHPDDARFAGRVIEMLDLAERADFALWRDLGDDEVAAPSVGDFDGLMALIASEDGASEDSEAAPPPVYLEFPVLHDDDDLHEGDSGSSSSPGLLLLMAGLAAAAAIAFGAYVNQPAGVGAPVDVNPSPVADKGQDGAPAPIVEEATTGDEDLAPKLATLAPQHKTPEAVKVFAEPGAVWSLHGEREYELTLEEGTVLVEFLPRDGEKLRVLSGDTEVSVIGTVFYVSSPSAEDAPASSKATARVGVLTGKVRVNPRRHEQGDTITLDGGQEMDFDEDVEPIAAQTFEASASLVDIDAHERMLETIEKERTEAPSPKAPKPTEDPAELARERKEKRLAAMKLELLRLRSQDQAAFAKLAEEYFAQVPRSRDRDLRRFLAISYVNKLGRPQAAKPHLEVLIDIDSGTRENYFIMLCNQALAPAERDADARCSGVPD
ncbi:MAG: hypothetical protein AAGI01_10125 [Myxococcota bacterium]